MYLVIRNNAALPVTVRLSSVTRRTYTVTWRVQVKSRIHICVQQRGVLSLLVYPSNLFQRHRLCGVESYTACDKRWTIHGRTTVMWPSFKVLAQHFTTVT